MMRRVFVILTALLVVCATAEMGFNPLSDEYIEHINSIQSTWKAGRNFPPDTSLSELKRLLGRRRDYTKHLPVKVHDVIPEIPEKFDARKQWPNCESISEIGDQGGCGSCWAISTTTAISDRICIHSNGAQKPRISTENLLSCCWSCGNGCDGGQEIFGWHYWVQHGIVTGGAYNSSQGCQPYEIEPCEHHVNGTRPECKNGATPQCHTTCTNPLYQVPYEKDFYKGKSAYTLKQDIEQIQTEILTNGPVTAGFDVAEEFLNYKSGVYVQRSDKSVGGHAVRVLGWGTENNLPYWLVANSWNTDWGDQGYFKIIRGKHNGGFEEDMAAGIPLL